MSELNTNVLSTYEASAATRSGQGTYRVVDADSNRASARTLLVFSKPANSNKGQLELSDPMALGYNVLATDLEEVSIAGQRRANRGRLPGRRIAD